MNSILDLVKYLVYGMIVYILFTYVPQVKLPLSDVMVITIVIMMTYIFLDLLAPHRNIENLDPDFFDQVKQYAEENNIPSPDDPLFTDLSNKETIGLGDENENVNNSDSYLVSTNDESPDKSLKVARILVNSGLSSNEIGNLLEVCKVDKNGCYNKINTMKNDEIISKEEFDDLVDILIGLKSDFESLVNLLDLENTQKIELIKLCKFNKKDCQTSINLLDNITDEQKIELLTELDNLYSPDYLLDISILPQNVKNEIKELCSEDIEKCKEKIYSLDILNEDQKSTLINSFSVSSEQQEIIVKQKNPKFLLLQKLLKESQSDLNDQILENVFQLCTDNQEKCINKFNELVLAGQLNTNEKILFNLFFGLNGYINLFNIINDKNMKLIDVIEISYVTQQNIPLSLCGSVLKKFIYKGKISDEDSEEIIDKLRKLNQGKNVRSSEIINQLVENDDLTILEATTIHKTCSLKNSLSCANYLKNTFKFGNLTETQTKQILMAYNKYDSTKLDTKNFGSISNESDLGSRNTSENLSAIKNAYGESEMKYTQLDPRMHTPLGEHTKDFGNKFEYGYSYLNTDKWTVPMYRPPVCKTDNDCKVCPSATSGYPVDLKEWNKSTKIMPPDNISLEYINKLNDN